MNTEKFKPGDLIRYIPGHAGGDIEHQDCEDGICTSINSTVVFCRFVFNNGNGGNKYAGKWRTIANSEACNPDDLVVIVAREEWER